MNSLQSDEGAIGRVPQIFSKPRRAARYRRALAMHRRGDGAHWLEDDLSADFLDRVDFMRLPQGQAHIIGEIAGGLGSALIQRGIEPHESQPDTQDEEAPWAKAQFDYIFSLQTLDTINDLPGALIHYREALKEKGLLFAQCLGAGSLPVLRQVMLAADGDRPAARIHPQIDNRAATGLLERAGFARQVVDSRRLKVRYSSFARLLGDLRDQALTSVLQSPAPYLGKAGLERAREAFDAMREEDGKVTESFEILTLTGWR